MFIGQFAVGTNFLTKYSYNEMFFFFNFIFLNKNDHREHGLRNCNGTFYLFHLSSALFSSIILKKLTEN